MDTQPTQHGLMQIFNRLGLASNNSLTGLKDLGATDKGFSGLLSGYLPNDAEQSAALADEGLPLLGQKLPLEAMMQSIESPTESVSVLSAEDISLLSQQAISASAEQFQSDEASEKMLIEKELTEKDSSVQALEEQGFYAQSLVSSLIGNNANGRLANADSPVSTSAMGVASESAKAPYPYIVPQNIGNNASNNPSNNPSSSTATLTASELAEMSDQAPDRFLGSEPISNLLKSRKTGPLELLPTAQTTAPLTNPATVELGISLALARNEDPTSQSLNELIDGETLEKGELEAKLTTLERKQDDQTLKLNKGQQAWGDALMERITMNAAKDIKQVTIHLDPPELGSLELKLHVKDDQQTQVHVQVQNPQVKEALESSAHRLRDMLASQGLELSEFDVQADTGRGDQFAGSDDQPRQNESQDSDTSQNVTEEIRIEIPKAKNNNILDTFV